MIDPKEEILSQITKTITSTEHKRFSIDVGTGVGKSFLIIQHMIHHYHESAMYLMVNPRASLKKNFKEELKKFGCLYLLDHIEFTTYLSFKKVSFEYDWIYLDECHTFKSKDHYRKVNTLNSNIMALTGTYFEKDTFQYETFTQIFPLIYVYKARNAVRDKVLNDYRIFIHRIPLSKTIRVNAYPKFMTEIQGYIQWNSILTKTERDNPYSPSLQNLRIVRMKFLQNCLSKVHYAKVLSEMLTDKTIIFTESIEHSKQVSRKSYNSKNPKSLNEKNLEDFKQGKINILSAVGQLNEGINIPNLKNGIILHSYANQVKSTQRIGRLLRLNPKEENISFIHILVYTNTIDETWYKSALKEFDNSKIAYVSEEQVEKIMLKANLKSDE